MRMSFFSILNSTLVIVVCLGLLIFGTDSSENSKKYRLLLISLDGFRWDFLEGRANTPTFNFLKQKGVHARKGIQNEFITNTLPNHFTLVTGLHVESHGMIDNLIYDTDMDQTYMPVFYDLDAVNDPRWLSTVGEPIWISNQIQRRGSSGVLMWMGGETAIRGVRPTRFTKLSYEMEEKAEVNLLMDWLTDDEEPIDLGAVYFHEPDTTAHLHGPESEQVTAKIEQLDRAIAHLLQSLERHGMSNNTDIILTSDHGFTEIGPERSILIDDIVDPAWYKCVNRLPGPAMSIFPHHGKHDIIYDKLKEAADVSGRFHVYNSADIPERFRYRGHRRTAPIFATAIPGYSFVDKERMAAYEELKGNHGYDNEFQDMRPFFVAYGPSFKRGFSVETFPSVDIYPLMCHLKGISPTPNNGSMAIVSTLLRHYQTPDHPIMEKESRPAMWTVVSVILLVMAVSVSVVTLNGRQDLKKE